MRIVCLSLKPTIPTQVFRKSIVIIFGVFFVVLDIITDQVMQGKAVVGRNKVDTVILLTLFMLKQILAAGNAGGKFADRSGIAPQSASRDNLHDQSHS